MASDRTTLRKSAVERRPPAATRVQRSSVETQRSPAQTLQSRLGNRATQILISRSIAQDTGSKASAQVNITTAPTIQLAQHSSKHTRLPAKVSKQTDPAELEAEETARKVMRMGQPPATKPLLPTGKVTKTAQRAEATPASTRAAPARSRPSTSRVGISGGAPLPSSVRTHMEPRFGANFSNVRVHTDHSAAQQSSRLGASAFTVGEHIFFGKDKFQPQSSGGQQLIAHELTHTIQQQAVVQRQVDTTVTQRSEPRIQRFSISEGLDWIADKANLLPGFRMLTIVLGVNPINMSAVDASPGNILRALLEMIPVTGALVSQALAEYGIFDKVGGWIAGKVKALGIVGSSIKSALMQFLDELDWTDLLLDLDDVYERGKRIITGPIDQLIDFITSTVVEILVFIREAILLPLAKLAEKTPGYDLLKAVLGKDPVTGEKVTPTPEVLIGGFMKLIGQEEVWQNAQKANAIDRLWAWFQGAVKGLMSFVSQIPDLIISTLESLEIGDLFPPTKAFVKVATAFGGFLMSFITWAGQTVWTLLEIIFDVVSPGALEYIKKTGAALQSILKNPIPFVGNLVKAAKLGINNFKDNFVEHLKAGLIDWLLGALPGIYIPKAFSLIEIAKFVFSVLGLTWANIRQKLVKAIGETAVKVLETTFDIVVTLVTEGPAAAWDKIKEQLANLKDMVIGGIIDMIVDAVVKKAIPKLIAMFIPGAGFISAILSIYDTVMVFVNKLAQIAAVVKSFVDSIVAIANGQIGAAAARVEKALAGVLSLAINFLAGFAGLGKVADKVMEIVNKIRAPIDKALDWLINWIVTAAKKLGKMIAQAGVPKDPAERLRLGVDAAIGAAKRLGNKITKPLLGPIFAGIKLRYGLSQLDAFERGGNWWVRAAASPPVERNMGIKVVSATVAEGTPPPPSALQPMPVVPISFNVNTLKYVQSVYDQQLKGQESGLNAISVTDWEKNRATYATSGRGSAIPQEEVREIYRKDLKAKGKTDTEIEDELERLAALHEPDLVAGGFNVIGKLGSRYINSSIGSQWRTNVLLLEAGVGNIKPAADKVKYRINVKLTSKPFTP